MDAELMSFLQENAIGLLKSSAIKSGKIDQKGLKGLLAGVFKGISYQMALETKNGKLRVLAHAFIPGKGRIDFNFEK